MARGRKKIELSSEKQALYKELQSAARYANQKLLVLERGDYGKNTWAASRLRKNLKLTQYKV